VANAASSLTATADGGTCIQTITLASGSRTGSVYLKRLTGTGAVQVSLDGSTWSTVDLSADEWRRIVLSGTVTNPVVGVRIATSGDSVAMDFGQVEDGAFATSPVLTTVATATRAGETSSIAAENIRTLLNKAAGYFAMSIRPMVVPMGSNPFFMIGSAATGVAFYNTTGGRMGMSIPGSNNNIGDGIFAVANCGVGASWGGRNLTRVSTAGGFDVRPSPHAPADPQQQGILFNPNNSTVARLVVGQEELSLNALSNVVGAL
jgi:hypothetical protein